jgi:hypothetical protein
MKYVVKVICNTRVYLVGIISCIFKMDKVLGKACENLSDRQAAGEFLDEISHRISARKRGTRPCHVCSAQRLMALALNMQR